MNFQDFQSSVSRTASPDTGLQAWALWLTSEAGEVAGNVIKVTEQGMVTIKGQDALEAISAELGDVLFCVSAIATYLGLDLGTLAKENIEKIEKRYPDGFVKGGGIR